MQKLRRQEAGFTIGSLLVVLVLVVAGFFAYRFVVRANSENKQQAANLTNALTGEGDEVPAGTEDTQQRKSSADQTQLWENPIRDVKVKIDPLTVTFTATLPGSYQGTCTVEINQPDGTGRRRFVTDIKGAKTCEIYIPVKELADSAAWRYQVGYFSDDGRTYGKYPEATLRL